MSRTHGGVMIAVIFEMSPNH